VTEEFSDGSQHPFAFPRAAFDPLRARIAERWERSRALWDRLLTSTRLENRVEAFTQAEFGVPFGRDGSVTLHWLRLDPPVLARYGEVAQVHAPFSHVLLVTRFVHALYGLQPDVVDEYVMDLVELATLLSAAVAAFSLVTFVSVALDEALHEALAQRPFAKATLEPILANDAEITRAWETRVRHVDGVNDMLLVL